MNEFDKLFDLFKSKYEVSNDTALLCTVLTCRTNEIVSSLEEIDDTLLAVEKQVSNVDDRLYEIGYEE